MKILLLLISIIYSIIFFIFYRFSNGLDFFGNKLDISYSIYALSTNLLFETTIFFLIGILFYTKFINFSIKKVYLCTFNINKLFLNITLIVFIVFLIFFTISYYLNNFISNKLLLFNLTGLIFNISLYFFIIRIKLFFKKRILFKVLSLIFLYISSISGVYYLFNFDTSYIILLTLFYSSIFNLYIHIKYNNYISLIFGVFLSAFIFYFLFINLT